MQLRLAALALALTASPALAEGPSAAPPAPGPGRVGLGVVLGTGMEMGFRVPIRIGASLLLEPELGAKNATLDPRPIVAHAFKIGVGLAWTAPVLEQVRATLGGRLEFAMTTYTGSGSQEMSGRGAAVVGAEWIVTPRVSFGLEAQAGYTYTEDYSPTAAGPGFDTAGLLVARVFPW
jgi:hypothetical protein